MYNLTVWILRDNFSKNVRVSVVQNRMVFGLHMYRYIIIFLLDTVFGNKYLLKNYLIMFNFYFENFLEASLQIILLLTLKTHDDRQ